MSICINARVNMKYDAVDKMQGISKEFERRSMGHIESLSLWHDLKHVEQMMRIFVR